MHVTTSYVTSKLMKNCSRGHVLQSYIARLVYIHGSLMVLNRTLAWEVLRVFSLMEMPHVKKYVHEVIHQVTRKI